MLSNARLKGRKSLVRNRHGPRYDELPYFRKYTKINSFRFFMKGCYSCIWEITSLRNTFEKLLLCSSCDIVWTLFSFLVLSFLLPAVQMSGQNVHRCRATAGQHHHVLPQRGLEHPPALHTQRPWPLAPAPADGAHPRGWLLRQRSAHATPSQPQANWNYTLIYNV